MRGDLPAGILSSQVKVVFRHQYHSYYSDKVPKKGWGTVALEKKDILSVKMFGNFSMLYNGVSLSGQKSGESQFITLMQLLIHNRNRGVSRDMAEEVLFGDRDIQNPHHALRSVVYNAKKKLEKAGLPKCSYIEMKNGILY